MSAKINSFEKLIIQFSSKSGKGARGQGIGNRDEGIGDRSERLEIKG
jgi:hypothetical protein